MKLQLNKFAKKPLSRATEDKQPAKGGTKGDTLGKFGESDAKAKSPPPQATEVFEHEARPSQNFAADAQVVRHVEQPRRRHAREMFASDGRSGVPPVPSATPTPEISPASTPAAALQSLFFSDGRAKKVRLDGPQLRAILGEAQTDALLATWTPIRQQIEMAEGGSELQQRPFRASVLTGNATRPAIVMGPTRQQGSFGKIRDCYVMYNYGDVPVHHVLKELRHKPARPRLDAHGRDEKEYTRARTGMRRTKVSSRRSAAEEAALCMELGGALPCSGIVQIDGKTFLVLAAANADLFEVSGLCLPEERSALARHVGERYAQHLAEMHRKNAMHVDGKLENASMVFEDGSVALTDFGSVARFDPATRWAEGKPRSWTDLAPEFILEQKFGPSQDIWCMGLTLLDLLGSASPTNLKQFGDIVACREELEMFKEFRQSLLIGIDGEYTIDLDKLEAHGELPKEERSLAYRRLEPAIEHDIQLTGYIIGHLLDPDPNTRHDAHTAERNLRYIADKPFVDEQMQQDILPRCRAASAHLEEPKERLLRTIDILRAAEPNAFAPPAVVAQQPQAPAPTPTPSAT